MPESWSVETGFCTSPTLQPWVVLVRDDEQWSREGSCEHRPGQHGQEAVHARALLWGQRANGSVPSAEVARSRRRKEGTNRGLSP